MEDVVWALLGEEGEREGVRILLPHILMQFSHKVPKKEHISLPKSEWGLPNKTAHYNEV